MQLTIS